MKTVEQVKDELVKIVGDKFPIHIESMGGEIKKVTYQTEWKSGTTTPVETGEFNADGQPIYDYKEDYKTKKLTKAHISEIDGWIKENIGA